MGTAEVMRTHTAQDNPCGIGRSQPPQNHSFLSPLWTFRDTWRVLGGWTRYGLSTVILYTAQPTSAPPICVINGVAPYQALVQRLIIFKQSPTYSMGRKSDFIITFDLSQFNVNVMAGNNKAYQRSPCDPVIQKWLFFFVPIPDFFSLQWNCHLQATSYAP